jgi:hypothetical protein
MRNMRLNWWYCLIPILIVLVVLAAAECFVDVGPSNVWRKFDFQAGIPSEIAMVKIREVSRCETARLRMVEGGAILRCTTGSFSNLIDRILESAGAEVTRCGGTVWRKGTGQIPPRASDYHFANDGGLVLGTCSLSYRDHGRLGEIRIETAAKGDNERVILYQIYEFK